MRSCFERGWKSVGTKCRACGGTDLRLAIDLGMQPACNAFKKAPSDPDKMYALRAMYCAYCSLLQTDIDVPPAEMFNEDYVYFSGQSKHWVQHCTNFAAYAIKRFGLNNQETTEPRWAGDTWGSTVVEIGGNDGTSLLPFKAHVSRVFNVEPSKSVAAISRAAGVPVLDFFFGGARGQGDWPKADLLIANNVMAHTPNLDSFVAAIHETLKPGGTATIEFPWVLNLVRQAQFDTIYHEHYSYLSVSALAPLFEKHKLRIYDLDHLPTHGGSLRIYAHRTDYACPRVTAAVTKVLSDEKVLFEDTTYVAFRSAAEKCRADFLNWLAAHPNTLGYGAAGKGNTFLNYCGLTPAQIPLVADTTPAKQGLYLPGSCIQVVPEGIVFDQDPEYLAILAWNWRAEIVDRVRKIRPQQKFVTAIPELTEF